MMRMNIFTETVTTTVTATKTKTPQRVVLYTKWIVPRFGRRNMITQRRIDSQANSQIMNMRTTFTK